MALEWERIVIDSRDPRGLGRRWADALDSVVTIESHEEFAIRPTPESTPGMIFAPVKDLKSAKNRVHPDFRPRDHHLEVNRLLRMGARRADVGQGEQDGVVLLDPEGNEFRILGAQGK